MHTSMLGREELRIFEELISRFDSLSEAQMSAVGVTPEWSAKDLLAHLAYWERAAAEQVREFEAGRWSAKKRTRAQMERRLMSQSTNGEIRAISLRSQVCTSSGSPVKRGLGSADCRDWKLPTQIISATSWRHSFAPFRKNNIVTGVVPLFRQAWRVPFCTTTSPRLR